MEQRIRVRVCLSTSAIVPAAIVTLNHVRMYGLVTFTLIMRTLRCGNRMAVSIHADSIADCVTITAPLINAT
jgi:hypothetical protein